VSKTHRALKAALTALVLERRYEAITVQDVIDRADVGRSTFYAHYLDKDDLLMAVFADLEVGPPDPTTWSADDPPFAWTQQLFRHLENGKHIFSAVTRSRGGTSARHETSRWLGSLSRSELERIGAERWCEPAEIDLAVSFLTNAFLSAMDWWIEADNTDRPADEVDRAFRRLVLPGLATYAEIAIDQGAGHWSWRTADPR
jgi:AcrR family transcriptional regulator